KDFVNDIEFKNAVIDMANSALLKSNGSGDIGKNIDFILEKTAYTCLNLSNVNMVYPMPICIPVKMAIEKYNLNVRHLSYTISWYAQENEALVLDRNKVNNEIIKFITRDATNVNFFVMDKNGDIIYKNSSLSTVVTEWNAKDLDKQTWDNSLLVMKEKKQMIFEETDKHKDFLSVKAPLVINNKVEGIIGLAIDITDRRKVENLQNELKMQKELFDIAKQVAHDINSPISSLKMIQYISRDKLSEQEEKMLDLTITSINNMAKKLIEKCRSTKEVSLEKKYSIINKVQEEYISLYGILTIVDCKRYQYQDDKIVTINFVPLATDKSVFIRGNFSNFQRMMNNLIDNAIEAGKREQIIVDVSSRVLKDNKIEIIVKDNGKGMPKEMAENLMKMIPVGTTKEGGHGIGTEQIISTIKMMKGEIKINTQEGVGTEFILRFERTQTPEWFDNQSEPEKDSTLIVLSEQVYKY
ncbi:MAG: HAMP domain-containing histidine kinase, partial [Endomicrobium sp.]|nr:HAMP domain-containing histidine kinase [Endomicrobium sp.]